MAASWNPEVTDTRLAARRHGGLRKRWSDEITAFLKSASEIGEGHDEKPWFTIAQDTRRWASMETAFMTYMQEYLK